MLCTAHARDIGAHQASHHLRARPQIRLGFNPLQLAPKTGVRGLKLAVRGLAGVSWGTGYIAGDDYCPEPAPDSAGSPPVSAPRFPSSIGVTMVSQPLLN